MKNKSLIAFLGLFTLAFFNCKSDDSTTETELTLDQIVAKVTDNGSLKTWKIQSATLTNSAVNGLDVTNAFNIKDDEFRFSQENNVLQLEHRQRHDFNKNANNYQSFLLEAYKSALNYTLINDIDTPSEINATNNALKFSYQNENLITGEWILDSNTKLTFNLSVKTVADYPSVPTLLNFEEVATIPSNYYLYESLNDIGIIGSESNNSIYISYRSSYITNTPGNFEVVARYDILNNQFNYNAFSASDFVTKRMVIIDNQLKVLGTYKISTYGNLNIIGNPIDHTEYNTQTYTRFDITASNNNIHIIGGSFTSDPNDGDPYFDKILSYDVANETLEELTTLPTTKCQAATEIIDNNIYIVSGSKENGRTTPETLSYKYNLDTNTFSEFHISDPLNVSFTATNEHLIYVGGQVFVLNDSNDVIDINAYLGVYNTEDNTFTEITHNLDDSDTSSRIHGIAYVNNALYIIYGNNNSDNTGLTKIYKAAL